MSIKEKSKELFGLWRKMKGLDGSTQTGIVGFFEDKLVERKLFYYVGGTNFYYDCDDHDFEDALSVARHLGRKSICEDNHKLERHWRLIEGLIYLVDEEYLLGSEIEKELAEDVLCDKIPISILLDLLTDEGKI